MKKLRKIIIRSLVILMFAVPVGGFAHFLAFPQETRCILIDWSDLTEQDSIYADETVPQPTIDSIRSFIHIASARIFTIWGQKTCNPRLIYCSSAVQFEKYGSTAPVPAITYNKMGSSIVLSNEGIDPDVIAHELSHSELYERTGFYNWTFKIPLWFKQGLSMQVDLRNYYSEDTLKVLSNNYRNLPDIKSFTSDEQFYQGSEQQVMLNYMTAGHLVKSWYSKEKLLKFTSDLNSGMSFNEAFEN